LIKFTFMIKRLKSVVVVFLAMCLFSWLFYTCNQKNINKQLLRQLSEYQIENKRFKAERQKDSSLIITQNQTILSQKEAIKLGLLETDKRIKEIESQLQTKIKIKVVEKEVPFIPDGFVDTSGWVKNDQGEIIKTDSISVPVKFALNEDWFKIEGMVKKNGLKIDTLQIPSKFNVTFGKEKTGFLGLGRNAVVQIKADNPYLDVTSINNIVVKKPKKFYNSPIFYFGIGILSGIFLAK
jgi:hypothetical protein